MVSLFERVSSKIQNQRAHAGPRRVLDRIERRGPRRFPAGSVAQRLGRRLAANSARSFVSRASSTDSSGPHR
jgi:hypothetical protein